MRIYTSFDLNRFQYCTADVVWGDWRDDWSVTSQGSSHDDCTVITNEKATKVL